MDKPKNVSIAKWGAACSPCALAKAKCLRSGDASGSKCDRCERLEKDCVSQVHKPRKKRQSKPSKTAQLEERLNSLVDLLKATNSGEVPNSVRHPSDSRTDTSCISSETDAPGSAHHHGPGGDDLRSPSVPSHELLRGIPPSYNENAPQICICRAHVGEVPMPLESDEALLATFVNKLMPEYPFVTLPPGITAAELVATRPFLFATIRMVSSYRNLRSMRAQNYLITRHISEQMLMRSERSLEMLQSILLVLGYYHYHCMMHSQMSNLTALANSLAADLGINRPPELQERTRLLVLNPEAPRARTNEERRALCGVWYINSIVSLAFQRMDPIKYTPYVDQCLRDLDSAREHETDVFLVHLVRIQHLSERIAQLHNKDHFDDDLGIARAPMNAYFSAFQTELDKYRAALPRQLRSNKLIICHLNTATLRLWEPPVIDMALLEKISSSFSSLSLGSASSLDVFYRSNAALKAWFEFWLSIDVTEYFVLPMPACAQLINAVTMLSRWAKLSSPDTAGYAATTTTTTSATTSATPSTCGTPDPPDPPPTQPTTTMPGRFRARGGGGGGGEPAIFPPAAAAVSAIKAHFLSQPELQIDILGILQATGTRFEEARRAVRAREEQEQQQQGKAAAPWENNIWDLAARKIGLTRLKLERWAEIVASVGGESLLFARGGGGGRAYDAPPLMMMMTMTDVAGGGGEDQQQQQQRQWGGPVMDGVVVEADGGSSNADAGAGWHANNSWANDLFEGLGLDQNFFFEGPGDYGTVVLNSLGQ